MGRCSCRYPIVIEVASGGGSTVLPLLPTFTLTPTGLALNCTYAGQGIDVSWDFGGGTTTLSPADRWTLELPLQENPWFPTVSSSDVTEFDGGELDDAVIDLEHTVAAD